MNTGIVAGQADELTDLIYAAMLGEADWQTFLDRLGDRLPNGKSMLFYHDANYAAGTFAITSGLDELSIRNYNDYYSTINPWMEKAALRKVGRAVIADEMLPHHDLERTEFYSDFLMGVGCRSAVGITLEREAGVSFILSTLTSETDPDRNAAAAGLLSLLSPHLRRAFKYYRRNALSRVAGGFGGGIADIWEVRLYVVDENGFSKQIGTTAEMQDADQNLVWLDSRSRLRTACSNVEDALRKMLDRKYDGSRTMRFMEKGTCIALVRVHKDRFDEFFEGPTVILTVEKPDIAKDVHGANALAALYGLTAAEARVLRGVIHGKSIRAMAEHADVSYETIKSQLKSIFAKTGTHGQLDLLRLCLLRRRESRDSPPER